MRTPMSITHALPNAMRPIIVYMLLDLKQQKKCEMYMKSITLWLRFNAFHVCVCHFAMTFFISIHKFVLVAYAEIVTSFVNIFQLILDQVHSFQFIASFHLFLSLSLNIVVRVYVRWRLSLFPFTRHSIVWLQFVFQ